MDVLPAGHEIGGYRIVRVAGRGAVGVVYEARHITLGKKVAIKTLNKLFAKEPEFLARFNREAEGGSSVDHPNITTVLDHGEQDGLPYLVMTYVDGPDLERILEDRDGPLEPAEAVMICTAVADALDAASKKGLSHRDVKPANILLADWDKAGEPGTKLRPQVYLTDFGLTKHNAAATVTRTGQFVGTLLYMAPEQIEGRAEPASDQYSLACVLWECLVGLPPYLPAGGSNLSLLTAHLSDPIPLVSAASKGQFSRELDTVFATAMAKKADDRYPTCIAFMEAVAEVLGLSGLTTRAVEADSGSTPAAPATPPPASRSWTRSSQDRSADDDGEDAGHVDPPDEASSRRGGWTRSPKDWGGDAGGGASSSRGSRGGEQVRTPAPPVPLAADPTPPPQPTPAPTPTTTPQPRPAPPGGYQPGGPFGYQPQRPPPQGGGNTALIVGGVVVGAIVVIVVVLIATGIIGG